MPTAALRRPTKSMQDNATPLDPSSSAAEPDEGTAGLRSGPGRLPVTVARIPILQETDPALTDGPAAFLAEAGKARGRLLNIYRAMANRPPAGRAFSELVRTVYRSRSTLAPRHGELAYLTATVVNNCFY
jgi:hypothetical protein